MSKTAPTLKSRVFLAEKWAKRKEKLAHADDLDKKLAVLDDYAFMFDIISSFAESIGEPEEELAFIKKILDTNADEINRLEKERESLAKEKELESLLF